MGYDSKMRALRIPNLVVSVLGIVSLAAIACGSKQSCTERGCDSGVHFESPIRVGGAGDQLTVTICKNGTCSRGTATGFNTSAPTCSVTGATTATCSVRVDSSGSAKFVADVTSAASDMKDGDAYTFRVLRGTTNETLVDVTKPAAYTTNQPNGPSCDPTCLNADLS
jgi:hypothetical protein